MSEKFRSKSDLFVKIRQITLLLNNRYRDGSKATIDLGFGRVRYAIVLLAAISLPSFSYHTKKIQDTNFAGYYNLYKVAKMLGLEFERNRAAPSAYAELAQRGDVKVAVENNRTFITLTERGRRKCEEILEDLQHLNEDINSIPLAQQKSRESGKSIYGTAKGISENLLHYTETEKKIDRLIKKISQW